MNQTRVFLIFAWLMVATLLWMEWGKEKAAPPVQAQTTTAVAGGPVPAAADGTGAIPSASGALPAATPAASATAAVPTVTVTTDVLKVVMDGGELRQADLLKFPMTADRDSPPVRLFADDATNFFVARSGWIEQGPAATRSVFVPEGAAREFTLAQGERNVSVPFVWNGPNGVTIRRTFTFTRGDYVVKIKDEVVNAGTAPWQGYVYRDLSRVPRALVKKGPMSAEQYSFQGAAWYTTTDKYDRRKYEDFAGDGPLDQQSTGGWIGMLQHHFFSSWIPQPDQAALFSLSQADGRYTISAKGPAFTVEPGKSVETSARLWVGPKLVKAIEAQNVPGLDRAIDFSRFSVMATIAGWLFWVLEKIYGLVGNWGWAIVGLVFLIKLAMYPLSAAQYKSMAKMRKFQPRMAQLKERYGDDKQKLQMAMMELYKKEKINPVGGCLPILLQMPVFLALYWMLSESVELRHAPWIGWITDLTSRDPYFILPIINVAVMWFTQKLNPTTGMDPMQAKMMQFMPLVFGVMFAFFPAGLVLYWVTNGALGLLQQWWMIKKYSDAPAKAA
ncbi:MULTISPECIES: membrane protein insertase YidC [unclassified Lysobacter]|uniref:membrane protein insertase YidC n=1 Tax=unclassified Lysobacter TaxID=2635362 RepID=UPI001C212DAD|nr:membrane protein insertase YidC [Lysobacter sp. MMG2]MBU8977177.1 membrane protein insertase YidC [Lysobacter sp. MMG2]